MQRYAVDIVLVPPDHILDKLIEINSTALKNGQAWGPLGKDDFVPHISLAMGGIETEDLNETRKIVESVSRKHDPVTIKLIELIFDEKPDGSRVYEIRAEKTSTLQTLHEGIMDSLKNYFSYDLKKENLYFKKGEEISDPHFINEYREKYSYANFDSHITIRTKIPVGEEYLPMIFKVNELAMFQVGKMTTCRRKLFSLLMSSQL